MTKRKTAKTQTVLAEHRLRRIEGGVNAIRSHVQDLRVSLAPLVPHVGAIEGELHDVQSSLDRIERSVVRPTRRVAPSRPTRSH
jgi:DNA-binding FrmR family transcriptional regulator